MEEDEILEIIKEFLELQYLNSTNYIKKSYLNTYQNAIQGLLDLYCKEKKKNKKIENKLKYDINKLDEKIKEKASLYGERYNKTRLKGIRTKCKEILRFMEEI